MTIAAVWLESGLLWSVADTRIVAGQDDRTVTEIASKIYAINMSTSAYNPIFSSDAAAFERRQPHYWQQYGFVYAGAVTPASQTAVTASTVLQNLARPGDRCNPPIFEEVAELIRRLAYLFMEDTRLHKGDALRSGNGLFSAAFFGWCPFTSGYKVAHIDGRDDGGFRVELKYPEPPQSEDEPWFVLGSGKNAFNSTLAAHRHQVKQITTQLPRRIVEKMIAEENDPTVGGSTSIGALDREQFLMFHNNEASSLFGTRRVFNGLDLDTGLGKVGEYSIASFPVN